MLVNNVGDGAVYMGVEYVVMTKEVASIYVVRVRMAGLAWGLGHIRVKLFVGGTNRLRIG